MDTIYVARPLARPIAAALRNDGQVQMHCSGCEADVIMDLPEQATAGDIKAVLSAYARLHASKCNHTHVEVLDVVINPADKPGAIDIQTSAG